MAMKKQWYEIVAPKMFEEHIIGETLAVEPKQLIGRKLEVSILELVKDFSKFYIKLSLQIDRVEGQKAYTKMIGHDIMRERIYRMVRRHGRRVDVIEDIRTKDGVNVRVKTVFMLLTRTGTSMKNATRALAREKVKEIASSMTFEDLMESIIKGDFAAEVRHYASKAYPLASIEVRRTQVMEPKKKLAISAA
jgi:small subunit ribosomal protein S3Ae